MASQYDSIKTAEELLKEVAAHGLSTKPEDICRAQDIFGRSEVKELTRTHEAEMEKMLRAEIAHNIAEYVMEHDAVVYERQEEENNDLQLSATFRFLQPHEGEWKI